MVFARGHRMSYYRELMQQAAALCLTMSLDDVGIFIEGVDQGRLARTHYLNLIAETAIRAAGCARYDSAESFAFASNLTARARALYDPVDADQTLTFIRLLTLYMRLDASHFAPDNAGAELRKVADIWLDTWLAIEAVLDPAWKPGESYPPFQSSKPQSFRYGVSPQSIADPVFRREYIEYLSARDAFLQRERSQLLLHRAVERYGDEIASYFAELNAIDPEILGRMQSKAAKLRSPDLRACFFD